MASNHVIAHSQTEAMLFIGTPTLTIKFSGDVIRASHLNGPYTVSNLVLVDSSCYALLADSADEAWTTPGYSHTQFGTPLNVYQPLITG